MSAELNIYEFILQLVRTDSQFQEEDLSKLLPISTVQKGFGLYNGVLPISFNPHEDYEIDPYELMVNLDDDEERIEKLTQINLDIQKYNEWTAKKSADFEETNIWYAPIKEYQMWQFVVSKAKPAEVRETYIEDMITFINNEELYKLKEQLNIDEFVIRFNRMIYEYLRIMINEARELNGFNSEYMWFEPNKEFISWFHSKGLIINDITPLINVQKSNLFERPNTGLSPNSSWDKITIIIIPSEHSPLPHIHIISPEYNEIKTIDNFGFTEKQNIEKPNQLFDTFMKFAIAGGQINISDLEQPQLDLNLVDLHPNRWQW
jgi:hypothetical protein